MGASPQATTERPESPAPNMHIVHLGKYYPPHKGGIESVVGALCQGLVSRGFDVTAVVSSTSRETVAERHEGVRIIRVAQRALVRSQPINPGLMRALSELAFDVLHVHTPNPL